jgi:hypothetical protein
MSKGIYDVASLEPVGNASLNIEIHTPALKGVMTAMHDDFLH